MDQKCAVCEELSKVTSREDSDYIECPRCDAFKLSGTARAMLSGNLRNDRRARASVSHSISKLTRPGHWPLITSDLLQNILHNAEAPDPAEQIDNLVQWLGNTQDEPGSRVDATTGTISAVGAIDWLGLAFIASEARRLNLVHAQPTTYAGISGPIDCWTAQMHLTIEGWARFGELRRGTMTSRVAFMAMPFGDIDLNRYYEEYFKPAVAATGFTLKRLDEGQPAGLIDDRLRVEIRQCRFLISDLTHRNSGAYWEAGYAEGLGKPVIYTCRKDVFDDERSRPHFDTNHHLTVT